MKKLNELVYNQMQLVKFKNKEKFGVKIIWIG